MGYIETHTKYGRCRKHEVTSKKIHLNLNNKSVKPFGREQNVTPVVVVMNLQPARELPLRKPELVLDRTSPKRTPMPS